MKHLWADIMKDYTVTIINSLDEFKSLAGQWNELLARSYANNIFLTWEWQFSWAECFLKDGKHLFVLAVYRNDTIVGIAPFYLRPCRISGLPIKQIGFLGTPEGDCDYLDVIISKGEESAVSKTLYDFLFSEASRLWDCLKFTDIRSNSLFLLHLMNCVEAQGKYLEITKGSFCPYVSLPSTREQFYKTLSSNRREQFRRHLKLLMESGNVRHLSVSPADSPQLMDEFFTFYEKEKGVVNTPLKGLLEHLILNSGNQNRIQLDLLISDKKIIAGFLHLCHENTMYMYLMAVNKTSHPKISIGNVLVGLSIEKAIDRGFCLYDFLKGEEAYKFHWANGFNTSQLIFLAQRKAVPLLLALGRFAKHSAKLLLR
jgi:CelD/BcsL family acetyltransferase involved in cellulose biosynthesis